MKKPRTAIGVAYLTAALAGAVALVTFAPAAAVAHPSCSGVIEEDQQHDDGEDHGHEEECNLEQDAGETEYLELGEPVENAVLGDSLGGAFVWSDNMTPLGFSARYVTSGSLYNSDLAFWGNLAAQGHYAGFRLLDISNPADPVQLINYTACGTAGQGDVILYQNLLIRSWDAPQSASCGGVSTGTGFEGINIFDVSNPSNPQLVRHLRMASSGNAPGSPSGCGSHTATAVPDPARATLYLYVGGSSGSCTGMDVVRINLLNPNDAVYVRRAAASRQCHDNAVILGNVNRAICAGGNGFSMFRFDPSLDPDAAGGIANPTLMYSRSVSGVSIGHSGSFTFDGKVVVFGHEPGGGSQAQCQSSSSVVNRSIYFFDVETGTQLGTLLHPRPQTAQENCTWHNFNVVPTKRGYVFTSGNYQSGIYTVDFTNPSQARVIGFADPARLGTGSSITLGGDWSTYWYNGRIYESDIRRGLITWKLDDVLVNNTLSFPHLNPQTQEVSFDLDVSAPEITLTTPVDGGQYLLGSEVLADYSCSDPDLATCEGTVANGAAIDTSTIGFKTFTVEASDTNGNTTSRTVTYNVHWPFTGFFAPIGDHHLHVAKAGAVIPVKFDLGGDRGLEIFQAGYPKAPIAVAEGHHPDETPCTLAEEEMQAQVLTEDETTTANAGLRYSDNHYQYVWKTKKEWAGSCRELTIRLVDNTTYKALFQFK
ncbi:MAG TPA: PxKF domain-containing protein [Actinomycetota bacterium]|nr:PxKF domain-containing protein [Actinomycetota bacterium]